MKVTRASSEDFVNISEAAERLGMSEQTIYKWLTASSIPGFKVASQWYIPREKFDKLILGEWKRDAD